MRQRAMQLACLLLLLSTLGAADGVACAEGGTLGGHYVARLMQQAAAAQGPESVLARSLNQAAVEQQLVLMTPVRTAMPMQPPSVQAAQVQAVTASGL